jgi:predicted phosphodiesterase
MPVRILAVADEVSPVLSDYLDPSKWKEIDLIVSCGDLPPDYLDFLATGLGKPVFFVRGNHDGAYPPQDYAVGQNLHRRIVNYRGLRIAGFEGCRRYNHGEPQYTEREMNGFIRRLRIASIRRGAPDLVVTHAPPLGIHDGDDPCHRGFAGFNTLIEAWKPAYFVHGHTHAYERGERVTVVGTTTVVNAYPFHVFEIGLPVEDAHPDTGTGAPVIVPRVEHSRIGT